MLREWCKEATSFLQQRLVKAMGATHPSLFPPILRPRAHIMYSTSQARPFLLLVFLLCGAFLMAVLHFMCFMGIPMLFMLLPTICALHHVIISDVAKGPVT